MPLPNNSEPQVSRAVISDPRVPFLRLLPFLLLLAFYLCLPVGLSRDWADTNTLSRLYLTHALSERGTVNITSESIRFQGIDDSVVLDHSFYSNKAPGSSFWLWAVSKPAAVLFFLGRNPSIADLAFFGRMIALILPFLIFLMYLGRHLERRTGNAQAAWLTAGALAVGTNAGVYSMGYYGHVLAAMVLGWVWIRASESETRPDAAAGAGGRFLDGFLLAGAVAIEYNAAPIALIVAIRLARSCPGPARGYALFTFLAGALLPAALLGGYHHGITGKAWVPPFHYDPVWRKYFPEQTRLIFGLTTPSLKDLSDQWISPARGVLFHSPWLIPSLAGAAWMLVIDPVKKMLRRPPASGVNSAPDRTLTADLFWNLLVIGVYATMMSCYIGWRVGFSTGMRLCILILPFCAVLTARVLAALPRAAAGSAVRLCWITLMTLSVGIFAVLATSFPIHAAPDHDFKFNMVTAITLRAWEAGRTALIWPHLLGLGFWPGIILMLSLPAAAWLALVLAVSPKAAGRSFFTRAIRRTAAVLMTAVLTFTLGAGWLVIGRDDGISTADAAAYWTPFLHSPSEDPHFNPLIEGKWSWPHDQQTNELYRSRSKLKRAAAASKTAVESNAAASNAAFATGSN
jgi:hypothetical protein